MGGGGKCGRYDRYPPPLLELGGHRVGIRAGYISKLVCKDLSSNNITLVSRICLVRLQSLQFSHLFTRFFPLFLFPILLPYTMDRSTITHDGSGEEPD